uniref:Uncharacterized protein n=3 Tax=Neisseria meningitidis TaxID=487 RepID=C6SM03_NEIME|nr:hypothetical protein predicted by Glimmer/Critica [Neisseria meningitidis alpha153]CBA09429.1 hypothetical protein predicted by Glimmer/Critica [Neisseria meningitidis alpha275]
MSDIFRMMPSEMLQLCSDGIRIQAFQTAGKMKKGQTLKDLPFCSKRLVYVFPIFFFND